MSPDEWALEFTGHVVRRGGVKRPEPGPLGTGKLTALDERVLAAITGRTGRRLSHVVTSVRRHEARYAIAPPSTEEEIRGILRGFEHLGSATNRGGWWRAL